MDEALEIRRHCVFPHKYLEEVEFKNLHIYAKSESAMIKLQITTKTHIKYLKFLEP